MSDAWISVDTVVENGEVHVLQQRVVAAVGADYGFDPHPSNEHRLIPMRELNGVAPNDTEVAGVDHVA
ncbi:hypothetical protein EXE43_23480 [Halorubrum sp. SS5]|uniref:hypothetical protein n=1 Tax=Halorubrum sp. SS7 TaxID=2518119 RepID=UPI0010F434CD|nr:hypothetical protein [Halorubrum sp. SS7]TKX58945.1 hypothetical protein EXE44_05205 [Halorubrum sp. SS7]TKX83586.1 hypothetical protein EXE43_23480 [Halorubrum sp. SS5]